MLKIRKDMSRRKLATIFRKSGYKVGAEIGVSQGSFSLVLFNRIPGLMLYCIDPYLPYKESDISLAQFIHNDNLKLAQERLSNFNAIFIKKTSSEAAKDIPLESLDFVYIDAFHIYDYVMEDLILWNRRVRIGGIISGHDYIPDKKGFQVTSAVNDYIRVHNIKNAYRTNDPWPSFFWTKTENYDE